MTQQPHDFAENDARESLILSSSNTITNNAWPKDYFDNFAQWQGEPLERPEQLQLEERLQFD
jgi:hypothetical protein